MTDEKILEQALLIRRTEEALLRLFSEGRLHGTIHTCLGQEFTGACLAPHLKNTDTVFSTHRGHGHYLSVTGDLPGFLGELLGKSSGCAGGRGGSQHLHRKNFFSNGIQGGTLPLAAGTAWAHQLDKKRNVAVAIIGDGTLGEGVLYETLNIAASWKLPLLVVLEDNRYAQSTKTCDVLQGSARTRLKSCGLPVLEADTRHWKKLGRLCRQALSGIRSGKGPIALIVRTERLAPHSTRDDFRPADELEQIRKRDPLNALLAAKNGPALRADARVRKSLETALRKAESSPPARRLPREKAPAREWAELESRAPQKQPYRALLNNAYRSLLGKNKNAVFLGEDLADPYGGCFKVSAGLSTSFPQRVRNTPISEGAIAGIATGAALMGKTAFAEFMFGDFTLLAMDQIVNHAAKFGEMFPARRPAVCFRAPMGGGRGYGPTHSQNLEKHFLGVPGLEVFSLNAFVDPGNFFRSVPLNGPRLLAEHKLLYNEPALTQFPAPWKVWREKHTHDHWVCPGNIQPQVILVGHGAQASVLWQAAGKLLTEREIPVALFLFTKLSGYVAGSDEEKWRVAGHRISFEEGDGYASFSAELAAQLPGPFIRWAPPHGVIPSAPSLEAEFRLTAEKVIAEVLEVLS